MTTETIHAHLRQAAAELQAAREAPLPPDIDGYLDGVEELISHHEQGGVTGSEALLYPAPGALDTIQGRLTEIIAETDDASTEHLQNARAQLLQAILLLDEQINDGRPTSSWR